MPLYKRVLLKLSGEVLAGPQHHGFDSQVVDFIAAEIEELYRLNVEIGIVIGGGNILRGATIEGVPRTSADTMGMLATVINSIYIAEALNKREVKAKVLTSIHIDRAGDLFTPEYAKELLKNGYVVIIGGGTGNPFFTTDTAAALRCAEIEADVFLKATKVDGIYDSDPVKNPCAILFKSISYQDALIKNLKVMDTTAFSFCMENSIPVVVFKLMEKGNLRRCIEGEDVGSIVHS